MGDCTDLALSVRPNCAAKKKPGGVSKKIFFGLLSDVASATFGAAGINSMLTLVFKEDKGLIEYDLKRDKNSATTSLEPGENANLRNHVVNAIVNWNTAEELGALEDLIDAEGVFAIVEQNGGNLEVYGFNKGANFDNFGLKASSLEGSTGIVMNDPTAFNVALSGQHTNLQLIYKPAQSLTANITELEALVVDPVA